MALGCPSPIRTGTINPARTSTGRPWLIALSLLAVYVVWGSTYLALRFMVEGFPPFLGNAIQWGSGFLIGSLLFVGGLGLVTVAEDLGIGSGLAATSVAMVPVWAALVSGFFDRWPTRSEWIGLGIGLAGVLVLSREGDFDAVPLGLVLVVVATILWSVGSVWSKHIDLPAGSISTAVQMLGGGLVLGLAGLVAGESITGDPGARSWWALLYLIGPGSLIAFRAYSYLLRTVRPVLATSYAFANPIVAVLLGVTIGGETLTGETWIALPMILLAVGLIARSRT